MFYTKVSESQFVSALMDCEGYVIRRPDQGLLRGYIDGRTFKALVSSFLELEFVVPGVMHGIEFWAVFVFC